MIIIIIIVHIHATLRKQNMFRTDNSEPIHPSTPLPHTHIYIVKMSKTTCDMWFLRVGCKRSGIMFHKKNSARYYPIDRCLCTLIFGGPSHFIYITGSSIIRIVLNKTPTTIIHKSNFKWKPYLCCGYFRDEQPPNVGSLFSGIPTWKFLPHQCGTSTWLINLLSNYRFPFPLLSCWQRRMIDWLATAPNSSTEITFLTSYIIYICKACTR